MGFSAEGLVPKLKKLGENLIGVEIGVCKGVNTKALLDACPNIRKIYAIDPWVAYQDKLTITQETADKWFLEAKERLRCYTIDDNVEIIKRPSLEAVKMFGHESLDFVYIDGNHSYEMALADCREWWPRVKKGGILSGHDFRPKDKEVRKAVFEFCEEINPVNKLQEVFGWSWFITKQK